MYSAAQPKTSAVRPRISLNATRHSLLGQIILMSPEDFEAYRSHCSRYQAELEPEGVLEVDLVQHLADLRWSINRITVWEANVVAASMVLKKAPTCTDHEQIGHALSAAEAIQDNVKTLDMLSRCEELKRRSFEQALKLLNRLQTQRKEAAGRDKAQAAEPPCTLH